MTCRRRASQFFGTIWIVVQLMTSNCVAKYVEGHLKTLDDWAFLARFCFISGRGKYEYEIEFDRKYGEPQLLLYYDDKTQWPSVYKSGKTCHQKLSVLSIEDNQIIKLSARSPYNLMSGCRIIRKGETTTPAPPSSSDLPTAETTTDSWTTGDQTITVTDSPNFDRFLKTTTMESMHSKRNTENVLGEHSVAREIEDFYAAINLTDYYDTDVFNVSTASGGSGTRNGVGLRGDTMPFENELENSTEYRADVEEMFQKLDGRRPIRQAESSQRPARSESSAPFLRRHKRETLQVHCHNAGTFFSARERWWYIAVANCGSDKGLDITYRFKMTNGQSGDFWSEHYSADEMLIPPILLTEAISYSLLLIALFFCTIELKAMHLYHCTYRLFGFSVILQWFGVLIQGTAWTKYGLTGLGPHTTVGSLFMSASEITFLLLLLLMAKGYTISRARLSSCSIVKLTMFINTYIVSYIVLFVYQATEFDPGEVLNLYESPAGFGLSLLRCIAWCAFMISTATTIRKYPEKSSFYYPFGLFGSMWLLGGPFLTLVGIGVLDAWVRESVMCGTFALMAFGGHAAFLWLTWPSRANKSFPYHVRTNHVGIASDDDDGADYPRHTYEPSTTVDQNIIIPLSRRTEELINGIYGQYMYEQPEPPRSVNTIANTHSHASFPEDPNAPPEILSTAQLSSQFAVETESDLHKSHVQNRFATYLQGTMPGDGRPPIFNNETENQVDSGHPSLDHSGDGSSPSNNTTKSVSDHGSPTKNSRKDSVESIKSDTAANAALRPPPNKIILEPIEQSIRNMQIPATANVPKHLFAARKLPSD